MKVRSISAVSATCQIVWAAKTGRPILSEIVAPGMRGRRADGLALDGGEVVEAKAATWWKAALHEALRQWGNLVEMGCRLIVVAAVRKGAAFERPEIVPGVDLYVFTPGTIDVRGALEDLLREVLQGVGPRDLPRDLLREVFDGEVPADPEDFSLALWVRELGVIWAHVLEDLGFKPTFTVGWSPMRSSRAAPRVKVTLTREGFRLRIWWGRKPDKWVRVDLTEGLRPPQKSRGGYILEVRREELDRFLSLLTSEVEALIKVWEAQEH